MLARRSTVRPAICPLLASLGEGRDVSTIRLDSAAAVAVHRAIRRIGNDDIVAELLEMLGYPLTLGRRLEQNAIVFVERGGAPELVLLRKMRLVIDTQVWLDWLVFDDPGVAGLRAAVDSGRAEVLIDAAGLEELERVLAYPLGRSVDVAACLAACRKIANFVTHERVEAISRLPLCRDPDDQKFVTLAAGARADCLVTRDRELLRLRRACEPWFAVLAPAAFARHPGAPTSPPA